MVNPAINAALIASAANSQTAQQAVLQKLKKAEAYEPSTAMSLDLDGAEASALTELVGLAIVRPLGSGRYYLDRERQKERAAQQGWVALVIMLGVASAMASVIALTAL
ncbi:hypothetical protein OMW55_10330 [Sphingomonas sp. BN140010]|uniref:Uncharacterized protein n=1 Tax=Sphingomonas arvum TaxID=2992113 RepID=A0ABT3JGK5_9SPHN|nr:hypothetical protein [Sphingomonas sp. BN140010]MCW3798200.1 hypothetical protein [Sphingomonas sp. BN140010]